MQNYHEKSFSTEYIKLAMETDQVCVSDYGEHVGVHTSVTHLLGARIMWLNSRWFLLHGIDVKDNRVRSIVYDLILSRYAVEVSEKIGDNGRSPYIADRYGQTGGTTFGGSGRCLSLGGFNVKGCGATALVPETADWYHSHGYVWHEEAVREAIISEIMEAEAPSGAASVIALIDTGKYITHDDGTKGASRALIVREGFLRIGHLERSIFFGTSGTKSSSQFLDAQRVGTLIRKVFTDISNPSEYLREIIENVASHVAFTTANRLWPGGFLSSNVGLDGSLVDFGGFRALPSWGPHIGDPNLPVFGSDFLCLRATVYSVSYYYQKYMRLDPCVNELIEIVDKAENRMFDYVVSPAFDVNNDEKSSSYRTLVTKLLSLYVREQADTFVQHQALPDLSLINRPIYVKCKQLAISDDVEDVAMLRRVQVRLSQRPFLVRETLCAIVDKFLKDMQFLGGNIDDLLNAVVAASRRIFPSLPKELVMLAHACGPSWTLVRSLSTVDNKTVVWVQGQIINEEVIIGDKRFPLRDITDKYRASVSKGYCYFIVATEDTDFDKIIINVLDRDIKVTSSVVYSY